MIYRSATGIVYDMRGNFQMVFSSDNDIVELLIETPDETLLLATISKDELVKIALTLDFDEKVKN